MLHFLNLVSAALAAVSLVILSPGAQAADSFTGSFTGKSSGAFGLPSINSAVDSQATFSLEKSAQGETFVLGQPGNGSIPNKLTFLESSFTAAVDQVFAVGSLSYLNGQTFSGTHVSSVPLGVALSLMQPVQAQSKFEYSFSFDLTPNDSAQGSADRLAIATNHTPQTFTFEQKTYLIELLGFSQNGGERLTRSFQVAEDDVVNSTLYAQIKLAAINDAIDDTPAATDIPEPAAILGLLIASSCALWCRPLKQTPKTCTSSVPAG
jgi:hypothetical protein